MWVWVVGLLTSACAEPGVELTATAVDHEALVGAWRLQHGPGAVEAWVFADDGAARWESHDEWGDRSEDCRWRLDAGALRIDCPQYWTRTPLLVRGRQVVFAPLVRVAAVDDADVLAEWRSEVTGHGLGYDNSLIVEPDAPPPIAGDGFVVIEEATVRLHRDYRLEVSHVVSGSCTSRITLSRQRCALDERGALACRSEPLRPELLDEEERRELGSVVHAYAFDAELGEPALAGTSLSPQWRRIE
jgi:hypothetical protein